MATIYFLLLFSTCLLSTSLCESGLPSLDDPIDKTDWVDPSGLPMAPSSMMGKMKEVRAKEEGKKVKKEATQSEFPSSNPSLSTRLKEASQCGQLETQLWQCKEKARRLEEILDSSAVEGETFTHVPEKEKPSQDAFLFRHIRFLLHHLPLSREDSPPDPQRFTSKMSLGGEDLSLLRRFVAGGKGVARADVDRVLTDMFESFEVYRDEEQRAFLHHQDYSSLVRHYMPSSEDCLWLVASALSSWFLIMLWQGVPIWKLTCLLLVLSSAWHWTRLYKKALSQKHSTLIQSKEIPRECFPDDMTWSHFFFDSFFGPKDKCGAYHEALMVDPFWEVSPMMAVADTIVQFLLLPLQHIGLHLGKFFSALLGELTWMSSSSVLLFVFFALLLMLVMAFGYRFKLPFFLGTFEPREKVKSSPGELEDLKSEIKMLQNTLMDQHSALEKYIQDAKENQPAITGEKTEEKEAKVETLDKHLMITDELQKTPDSDKENKQYLNQSPHREPNGPETIMKSPRKRLVAKGSLLSPGETAFQWIEELEDDNGDFVAPETNSLNSSCSPHSEEKSKKFLSKIQTVFQDGSYNDE